MKTADGRIDLACASFVTTLRQSVAGARSLKGPWVRRLLLNLLAALALLAAPAFAAPGDLDTSFGSGGKVTTAIGNSTDWPYGVALQSDGKIVVAGSAQSDFAVVRYNANGTLDSSFGSGGKVTTDFGSSTDSGYSVAVQSDGKIVVAGFSPIGPGFGLVRYNANGTLDSGFGNGGKVVTGFAGTGGVAESVALQGDGKIVVSGFTGSFQNYDMAVARFNANGTLDSGFGSGGKVTTSIGTENDFSRRVVVQSDGKIVIAGEAKNINADTAFALVRYNANGALDNTFGTGGKVTTHIAVSDRAYGMALQDDGKIVVAGNSYDPPSAYYVGLVRYMSTGALDASFGTNGKVTTSVGGPVSASGVVVQRDGKIVVAGTLTGTNTDFVLLRYTNTGMLDTGFGSGGKVVTPIGPGNDSTEDVALQSDGKIVVTGPVTINGAYDFGVARYLGDPVPKVEVVGIEVVQSVQDLRNSVPLVADKDTYVRVKVQPAAGSDSGAKFTAKLRGFRGAVELTGSGSPLSALPLPHSYVNTTDEVPSLVFALRGSLEGTLNFHLPPQWTSSGYTEFRLEPESTTPATFAEPAEPSGQAADGKITMAFVPQGIPEFNLYRVMWRDSNNLPHQPSVNEVVATMANLKAMYPLHEVRFSFDETNASQSIPPDSGDGTDKGLPFMRAMVSKMQTLRVLDGGWFNSKVYFGALDIPFFSGVGGLAESIGGSAGCGRVSVIPHEIGHCLGRPHAVHSSLPHGSGYIAGWCGEKASVSVPDFPYSTMVFGEIVAAIGPTDPTYPEAIIFGLDTSKGEANLQIFNPSLTSDLMSYCFNNKWTSKFTYEELMADISERFPPASLAPNPVLGKSPQTIAAVRDMFLISGQIGLGDFSVSLETVLRVSLPDPGPPPAGTYSVQLLDVNGTVLSTTSFEPSVPEVETPGGESNVALINVLVPAEPGTAQIVIRHVSTVLVTRAASTNPPTVTVQSPNGGEVLPPGNVTIAWTANDADGDPLQFTVQYSADNGATWTTLTTGETGLSHTLSRGSLKASTTARIRVLASDGFYTTADISDGTFTVPNNPPSVFVREPSDQSTFTGEAQIFFRAMGYDQEDGSAISNVTWTSNLDGLLGTGLTLLRSAASLSVGTHLITATITDANGATQSSSFTVNILRYRQLGVHLQGRDAAGKMSLFLEGDPGTPYVLERSPDLQSWSLMETGTMPSVIREVLDPSSVGQPRYFWRARQ